MSLPALPEKELASDSYDSTSPAPGILAIQSKKITISDDVGIASNADDEGEEGAAAEALDDAAQTVINVVYSAKLTQVNLDKKEYKTLQKAYWKKLIDTLNELKWHAAHSHSHTHHRAHSSSGPWTAAAAITKPTLRSLDEFCFASADLSSHPAVLRCAGKRSASTLTTRRPLRKPQPPPQRPPRPASCQRTRRRATRTWWRKVKSYKTNFENLQKFVADEILPNFDECEFYTCEDGELGSCMLIPARYVGEAPAPVFYLFKDGVREKKE